MTTNPDPRAFEKPNSDNALNAKFATLTSAGAAVALTAAISFGAPSAAFAEDVDDENSGITPPNPEGQSQEVETGTTVETTTVPASVLDESMDGDITVTESTTVMDPEVTVETVKHEDGSTTVTTTTETTTEKDLSVEGQATKTEQGEVDIDATAEDIAALEKGDSYKGYTVISKGIDENGVIVVELSMQTASESDSIDAEELQKILGEGYTVEAGEPGEFTINGQAYLVLQNTDNSSTTRTLTFVVDPKGDMSEDKAVGSEEQATADATAAAKDQAIAAFEEAQGVTVDREKMTYTDAAGHTYTVTVAVNDPVKTDGGIVEGIPADAAESTTYTVTATAQITGAVSTWSETEKSSTAFITDEGTISATEGEKFPGTNGTVVSVKRDASGNVTQVVTSETADEDGVTITTVTTYNFTYGKPSQEEISKLQGDYEGIDADSLKKISWTADMVITKSADQAISVKDQATAVTYDDRIKNAVDGVSGTYPTSKAALEAARDAVAKAIGADEMKNVKVDINSAGTVMTLTHTIDATGLSADQLAAMLGGDYKAVDGKLMKGDAVVDLSDGTIVVVTTVNAKAQAGEQATLVDESGETVYFATEQEAENYIKQQKESGAWTEGESKKEIVKEKTIVEETFLKTISTSATSVEEARALLVEEVKKIKNGLGEDDKLTVNNIKGDKIAEITAATTDKQIEDLVNSWKIGIDIDEDVVTEDLTPEQIQALIEGLKNSAVKANQYADDYLYNHVDVDKDGKMKADGVDVTYELHDGIIYISSDSAKIANGGFDFTYTYPAKATDDGQGGAEYYMNNQPHGQSSSKGINIKDGFYKLTGKITYWSKADKSDAKTIDFTTYGYLGPSSNICPVKPGSTAKPSSTHWYGYDLQLGNIELENGKITILTHGVFTTSIAVEKEVPAWTVVFCPKEYGVDAAADSTISIEGTATTTTEDEDSASGSETVGEYSLTDEITVTEKDSQSEEDVYLYTGEDAQTFGSYKDWVTTIDSDAVDFTVRDLSLEAVGYQVDVTQKVVDNPAPDPDPDPTPDPGPTPDPSPDPDPTDPQHYTKNLGNLPLTGDSLPMGATGAGALFAGLLMALGLRRRNYGKHARH